MTIADIHFDPFIACHETRGSCRLIQQLRQANVSDWDAIFANDDKTVSEYREDTNSNLLKSALAAAKNYAEKNDIKFVLILGDLLAHNNRNNYIRYAHDQSRVGYQAFVKKTLEYLNAKLAAAFNKTDVYVVLGNNDSYQRDYGINVGGLFLSDASKLWSSLIKTPANRAIMQREFAKAGYYAVDVPGVPQLKLIVLNSVLFANRARGKNIPEAAMQQLVWLQQQLVAARNNNQRVFIAMHIPVGIDVYATLQFRLFRLIELWQPDYTKRFEALLKEFSPQIAGMFAGHLHSDWFQLLTLNNNKIPVTGTPAISPIFGNNPGFKIYSYSLKDQQLEDFQTYFYPIGQHHSWHVEYDFNQTYQSNCKRCDVSDGIQQIAIHDNLTASYKHFYAVSTQSQPISKEWNPYYRCAFDVIRADQYKKCVG